MTKKIVAFTLSEVLITLSILGVIAAVTIPSIYANYEKRMTITRLKIAYSILDNMTRVSLAENGYPPLNVNLSNDIFDRYFGKYLNINKYCGIPNSPAELKDIGCFKQGTYKSSNSALENVQDANGNDKKTDMFYTLDGKEQASGGYSPYSWHKVILKNGMGLATWHAGSTTMHGYIFVVDIDGPNKGQSKLGQDLFEFMYYSPKTGKNCKYTTLVPGLSSAGDINSNCEISKIKLKDKCKENGSSMGQSWNGMGCSGLIIQDGWKISNDYPWDYAHKKN